jgi:hypothetical protein
MTRTPNPSDPTSERTADESTQTASGLSGGRPGAKPAGADDRELDEMIPREGEDERTSSRRRDDGANEPALPSDDASLNTKI